MLIPFTYEDFQKLKARHANRAFTSRGQLLQLFYELYHDDTHLSIRIDRDTIERIAKEVHTFIPIGACEKIILSNHRLQVVFRENQAVSIPGTFGQVNVSFTKVLRFHVIPFLDEPSALRFRLEVGGIRVNSTWLTKLVSPYATSIQGSVVTYELDDANRCAIGTIEQHRFIDREHLKIHRSEGEVVVDALDEAASSSGDLRYTPDEAREFGVTTRLLEGDKVQIAGGEPKVDPELAAQVRRKIDLILRNPDAAFEEGVQQNVTERLNMETRAVDFEQDVIVLNVQEEQE